MDANEALNRIFKHNKDEEKEHAFVLLEGIHQNDEVVAKDLKANLYQSKGEIYYVFLFKKIEGFSF